MNEQKSRIETSRIYFFLLCVASLIPLWVAYRYKYRFLHEDSYITLTYVKNLVEGRGFVYNYPPAVLGTTTPLLTLIIAFFSLILPFLELPTVAVFLTAFFWIGIIWTIFLFRKNLGLYDWQAVIIGLVIIANGWVNNLGMEAYLFSFLLVLAFSLFLGGYIPLAGVATGLLFLSRGEGIIIFLLLGITALLNEWSRKKHLSPGIFKPALLFTGGFLSPVSIWLLYAKTTFGSFLPSTLGVKLAQGQTGLWHSFIEDLPGLLSSTGSELSVGGNSYLSFWWFLVFVGLLFIFARNRKWLFFVLWGSIYVISYTILDVPSYQWYQLPVLFVLEILVAFGLIALVEAITSVRSFHKAGIALSIALVAFTVFMLGKSNLGTANDWPYDNRAVNYPVLCEWINENTEQGESIAYIEVGYLGYFTNNRIIDLSGLVTPEVIPHIAERDFAWGFWNFEPDYYIYYPGFDWALYEIRSNPQFNEQYRQIAVIPGQQQPDIIVYKRFDSI